MPLEKYRDWNPNAETLKLVNKIVLIIDDYMQQGYVLSLRQLYYQMVARGHVPNSLKSYNQIGSIVTNARYAGMIDWMAIEDRGRELEGGDESMDDEDWILNAAKDTFHIDRWKYQQHRVEVWVEKDALRGVVSNPCGELHVAHFAARGYNSASEMWKAAKRFIDYQKDGLRSILLYLGDHDPSGIHMCEDIQNRLAEFGARPEFLRIALNMDQVEQYNPPENPAKETDSRYARYVEQFGDKSWELDALEPAVLDGLIRSHITPYINSKGWDEAEEEEKAGQKTFELLAKHWEAVKGYLRVQPPDPNAPKPGDGPARPTDDDEAPFELGPAGDPGMDQTHFFRPDTQEEDPDFFERDPFDPYEPEEAE